MVFGAALLAACTSVDGAGSRPIPTRVSADAGPPSAESQQPESAGWRPTSAPQKVLRFDEGLTWEATLLAALSRHPELLAAQAELEALGAEVTAAGRRPNPTLNVQIEDIGNEASFTGPSGGQTTVILTHTLERGGKRAAREQYSEAKREAAIASFAVRSQTIRSEARARFLGALSA
ncbi:MAG: cobalt-zinc-cadmium efflux system outer membrane protein [Planctomycetota bacterium]|jgi:cobalt-zinc-cadmium efflux system outer membrane protein